MVIEVAGRIMTAVAALTCVGAPASAQQSYPSRPIHLVVGFPAGSGADIGARFIGEKLQEVSRATIVMENKPGAGSNIAIGQVVNAKPDGYTVLLAASSAMAGSRYLYKDFKIDTQAGAFTLGLSNLLRLCRSRPREAWAGAPENSSARVARMRVPVEKYFFMEPLTKLLKRIERPRESTSASLLNVNTR